MMSNIGRHAITIPRNEQPELGAFPSMVHIPPLLIRIHPFTPDYPN
jgi:hypothetical protein